MNEQPDERPIIFSAEMIHAILAGRKTQTRRVVKPQQTTPRVPPVSMEPWIITYPGSYQERQTEDDGRPLWIGRHPDYPTGMKSFSCPYGKPGNGLWVKESWRVGPVDRNTIWYRDGSFRALPDTADNLAGKFLGDGWKSPRFMYRWASRIDLEITDIRVERVQCISEEDTKAEGIVGHIDYLGSISNPTMIYPAFPNRKGGFLTARMAYEALWDSLNAPRGYGWDVNPLVWVIEFKRSMV